MFSRTAVLRMARSNRYDWSIEVFPPRPRIAVAYQVRTSDGVRDLSGTWASGARWSRRLRSCVSRDLGPRRLLSSNHSLAYSRNDVLPAASSSHVPWLMLSSAAEIQRSASAFVAKVWGADCRLPVGPTNEACHRPDGSFRMWPKRLRVIISLLSRFASSIGEGPPGRPQ